MSQSLEERIEAYRRRVVTPETRRRAAHHEAGHAVIAWFEKRGIKSVSIAFTYQPDLDWDSFGRLTFAEWDGNLDYEEVMLRDVRINMAGRIAEQMYRGKRPRMLRGSPTDMEHIEGMLQIKSSIWSKETCDAWLRWQWLCVRDKLQRSWPMVTAVAEALLERETLTGDECDEILRRCNRHLYDPESAPSSS